MAAKCTVLLSAIDAAFSQFPEDASHLYYWRACMYGRTGDAAATLRTLTEAIAGGHTYPPDQLRWVYLARMGGFLGSVQGLFVHA